MTKLKIASAQKGDVFEDIVRINKKYRCDSARKLIGAGSICNISVGGKSIRAIVRGLQETDAPQMCLDDNLRDKLGIKLGDDVDVSLSKCNLWGETMWGWSASEPTYRISTRVALISFFLGIVSLLLGAISLWVTL